MTLPEFHEELQEINSDEGRPFICEGSPLDCNVFIVGLNPATSTSFSKHWDPKEGYFDREGWLDTYQEDKSFSNTRIRLNIIFNKLKDSDAVRLLETNLYNIASTSQDDLAREDRNTEVFNFLLQAIKPTAIVGHGKDTIRYLRHLSGKYYKKDEWFEEVNLFDFSTDIYLRDHLAYQTSHEDCRELADNILSKLSNASKD